MMVIRGGGMGWVSTEGEWLDGVRSCGEFQRLGDFFGMIVAARLLFLASTAALGSGFSGQNLHGLR